MACPRMASTRVCERRRGDVVFLIRGTWVCETRHVSLCFSFVVSQSSLCLFCCRLDCGVDLVASARPEFREMIAGAWHEEFLCSSRRLGGVRRRRRPHPNTWTAEGTIRTALQRLFASTSKKTRTRRIFTCRPTPDRGGGWAEGFDSTWPPRGSCKLLCTVNTRTPEAWGGTGKHTSPPGGRLLTGSWGPAGVVGVDLGRGFS